MGVLKDGLLPRPRTYLQAVLSPAKPQPRKLPPLLPLPTNRACFRCLATDHVVRDCRDPVRCRVCRGSGHRAHDCTLLGHALSRSPRRKPTVPASRCTVHAEPRAATSPRPPPTPNHQLSPTNVHHPIHIIPSSSSAPPDLELLSRPSLQPRARDCLPLQNPYRHWTSILSILMGRHARMLRLHLMLLRCVVAVRRRQLPPPPGCRHHRVLPRLLSLASQPPSPT